MSELPPNVRPPSPEEIREAAARHHIDLSEAEITDFAAVIEDTLAGYDRLDQLSAPTPDGLPVGLMLVGRRFEDATFLGAAAAYEASVGWDPGWRPPSSRPIVVRGSAVSRR